MTAHGHTSTLLDRDVVPLDVISGRLLVESCTIILAIHPHRQFARLLSQRNSTIEFGSPQIVRNDTRSIPQNCSASSTDLLMQAVTPSEPMF